MAVIEDIVRTYRNYPRFNTKVLVASVRNGDHVRQAALIGADVCTIPPAILDKMVSHDLTESGREGVLWRASTRLYGLDKDAIARANAKRRGAHA